MPFLFFETEAELKAATDHLVAPKRGQRAQRVSAAPAQEGPPPACRAALPQRCAPPEPLRQAS